MTIWSPDSCNCKIEYDSTVNWIKTHNRCNHPAHKNANGQAHLTVVIAHNQAFNMKHGEFPTETQQEEISKDKADERSRIKKL